jgi:hypothetical protein
VNKQKLFGSLLGLLLFDLSVPLSSARATHVSEGILPFGEGPVCSMNRNSPDSFWLKNFVEWWTPPTPMPKPSALWPEKSVDNCNSPTSAGFARRPFPDQAKS